jgi:hypothetical protein
MESQNIEKDVTLPDKDEDPFSETAGLAIVLERLRAYLGVRAEAKDIEILSFSLHHLFYSFNILFQRTLSQLTVSSSQVAESELPRQELGSRYRSWTSLQEIMRLLERIEALCQLLNGAATSMLTSLNTISSIEAIADAETVVPLLQSKGSKSLQYSGCASTTGWNVTTAVSLLLAGLLTS